MEEFVAKFVTEFHTLKGLTVNERKTNLYLLFNNASILHSNSSLADAVTAQLRPVSHLEQLFLIEFLIKFQRYKELAREVLENHNNIAVKRLSKEKWFFERLVMETGAAFITEILPTLSYNLTLRILKNIAPVLTEQQGDEMFNSLLNNYGLSLALCVITSCSVSKVELTLKNYYVKLWSKQLKSLFDKSPKLVYIYLEERTKHEGNKKFMDSNPIFRYIAERNFDIYQDLCQKFDFKGILGKHLTKKFVDAKKQDILTHPELYVKHLNASRLIRALGADFEQIYFKLFPKKVADSPAAETSTLLKYYPKYDQYRLMVGTYNAIFAKKLDERPHLIDDHILQMISDPSERERMAKLKGEDNLDYHKYYAPQHCLKFVKEKINFARDSYQRSAHVATLVQSCLINKDYNCLLEVARFASERFKNDVPQVQLKFMQLLTSQGCDFNKLTQEHWTEINNMRARSSDCYSYDYGNTDVFYKYMEFLIKADKPINEVVSFYKKSDFFDHHVSFMEQKGVQRKFLCEFIDLIPQIATSSKSVESLDCKVLAACLKYNSQNPKNIVDVSNNPRLLQSLKNALTQKITLPDDTFSSALQLVLCTKQVLDGTEELWKMFWTNIKFANPFIIQWLLKYRPELVKENLPNYLSFILKNQELVKNKKFWWSMKCYTHLSIDTSSIEIYRQELTPTNTYILSHLMPQQDFLALVQAKVPTPSEAEGGISSRFDVQKSLLRGLNHVNLPVPKLDLIMQFCCGDYISASLAPITSAVYNAPRNCLESYLDTMKTSNNLHLKQRAYHLISKILQQESVLNSLLQCQLDQSVIISFNYFLTNQSNKAWDVFVSKLNVSKSDSRTCKVLATKCVPMKYKASHIEHVWPILRKNNDKNLSLLTKNVQNESVLALRPEFLSKLVDDELFHCTEINEIIISYLFASKKLNLIDTALEKYKNSVRFCFKQIYEFADAVFSTYMEFSGCDENLVDGLLTLFQKICPIIDIFEVYITLSLMRFKNKNPSSLSALIIQLHNNVIAQYDETVTYVFADVLKKLLPRLYRSDPPLYEFYYLLLNCKKSIADVFLLIKILPIDSEPEDRESFNYYERIMRQLQELNIASVQLHLNLYFKNRKIVQDISYYQKINKYGIYTSSWLCPGARRKIGYMYY